MPRPSAVPVPARLVVPDAMTAIARRGALRAALLHLEEQALAVHRAHRDRELTREELDLALEAIGEVRRGFEAQMRAAGGEV